MNRLGKLSIKLVDIMIGVVLGLGFQWWPNLHEPWQYAAFIFVYFDLIDYWIDYSAALKKFPPKRELGVMLDVAVIFTMFLYIYTTQLSISSFLWAFVSFRVIDTLCLWRARSEHGNGIFIRSWIQGNLVETVFAAMLIYLATYPQLSPTLILGTFIVFRIITRIVTSLRYKKVYLG